MAAFFFPPPNPLFTDSKMLVEASTGGPSFGLTGPSFPSVNKNVQPFGLRPADFNLPQRPNAGPWQQVNNPEVGNPWGTERLNRPVVDKICVNIEGLDAYTSQKGFNRGELLFQTTNSQLNDDYKYKTPVIHADALTLSRWNVLLWEARGREHYGTDPSGRKLMSEWIYQGVTQYGPTEATQDTMTPFHSIATFRQNHCEVINVWYDGLEKPFREGAHLWLVPVLHEDEEAGDHYYQVHPMATQNPRFDIKSIKGAVGYWFVGTVTKVHIFATELRECEYFMELAEKAVHPWKDPSGEAQKDYRIAMTGLPTIEVNLNIV